MFVVSPATFNPKGFVAMMQLVNDKTMVDMVQITQVSRDLFDSLFSSPKVFVFFHTSME